jgi:hypothetical protein
MKEMLIEKNFAAKRANKGKWDWVVRWPHLLIYPFIHLFFPTPHYAQSALLIHASMQSCISLIFARVPRSTVCGQIMRPCIHEFPLCL